MELVIFFTYEPKFKIKKNCGGELGGGEGGGGRGGAGNVAGGGA